MDFSLDSSRPNWPSLAQRYSNDPAAATPGLDSGRTNSLGHENPPASNTINQLGLDNTSRHPQVSSHAPERYSPFLATDREDSRAEHRQHALTPARSNSLDCSRPRPKGTGFSTSDPPVAASTHRLVLDDQERIVNDSVLPPHSRSTDFLKLVNLWTTVVLPARAETKKTNGDVLTFASSFALSQVSLKILGRGLSFEVMLLNHSEIQDRREKGRKPVIVYKKLRGLNDQLKSIEKNELLRAALLEVRVLTHPPLQDHPNIIKLFDLTWEPDLDLIDHAWPVIVLEYADHGSLADFQEACPEITFSLKRQLCLDVGNGLMALHACGIVHGDLKSENVLICLANSDSKAVIAKLADFGCAVADIDPSENVKLPAFTFPWNSPECHDRRPRDELRYSDVYSYGLLVWRVMLNGVNPFRCIDHFPSLDKVDFQREIEARKRRDDLVPLAESTLRPPFCNSDVELTPIHGALRKTLRLDPLCRDLHGALTQLSETAPVICYPPTPLKPYEYELMEINLIPGLVIPISLVLSTIRELKAISAAPGNIAFLACFQLFQIYMQRLEWPGAKVKAAKWYLEACQAAPDLGLLFRLHSHVENIFGHLGLPVPAEVDLVESLQFEAAQGCYDSLIALQGCLPPSDFLVIQNAYQKCGGIMSRETKREILFSPSYFERSLDALFRTDQQVCEVSASNNGDNLLHATVRFGFSAAIERLLSVGVDIDSVNLDGETALLQAIRAGNLEAARVLLLNGANAALPAKNGETPLHWIFTFVDEAKIEQATDLLISHGAEPCLFSSVEFGCSSATDHIAFYGTPLHYAVLASNEAAVRALLSKGADPFFEYEREVVGKKSTYTPFRIAVVRGVLPKILEAMFSLTSPALAARFKSYSQPRKFEFLDSALKSASTIFLHKTLSRLEIISAFIETIDFLRRLEESIFGEVESIRSSLLHEAIHFGCCPLEIVEHILKTSCLKDLDRVARRSSFTPLQTAIYLNRPGTFQLLLAYGADIHRKLASPNGLSYLQYCAFVGPHGQYFAQELLSRGAVPENLADCKTLLGDFTKVPPAVLALAAGNFKLATFFARLEPVPCLVSPDIPILHILMLMNPRLPVSRLRYLLEPPEDFQPVSFAGNPGLGENCFHTLASSLGGKEPETMVNFQYLLQQAKARGEIPQLLNQPLSDGQTPLASAAYCGHLELVREMLNAGADPNPDGLVSCGDAANRGLQQQRKSRFHSVACVKCKPWRMKASTPNEFRWAEEDYMSIILLSSQSRAAKQTAPLPPSKLYTPESHGIMLFMHFQRIFKRFLSTPIDVRADIQRCLDSYFVQAGVKALAPEQEDAPLGSSSVRKLEDTVNLVLRTLWGEVQELKQKHDNHNDNDNDNGNSNDDDSGQNQKQIDDGIGECTILKRHDGWLRVILAEYPGEPRSVVVQRARATLGDDEWMGWMEMEEREAEILRQRFENTAL